MFRQAQKKYLHLEAAVKAAMCCFHGPIVKGTFSQMTNIITDNRGSMDCSTLDANVTCGYALRSSEKITFDFFHQQNRKREPVNANMHRNFTKAHAAYVYDLTEKQLEKERKLRHFRVEDHEKNFF